MKRILVAVSTYLGLVCLLLGEYFTEASRVLIRCPVCGRSRYYGEACNK